VGIIGSTRVEDRRPVVGRHEGEGVDYRVRFEWHVVDDGIHVRPSGKGFDVAKNLGPGVYRLNASVRGGRAEEDDAWYVGQSISSARSRIQSHVRARFDPTTGEGKRFKEILSKPKGWVKIQMARNISLNGNASLHGIRDGEFISASEIKKLSKEERLCVQFLLNLIESAGQVSSAPYFGAQGLR
jgi:hypothetical protein